MSYLKESEKYLIQQGLEELAKKFMSSAAESDSVNLIRMAQACEDLSIKISNYKEEQK